MGGKVNSQLPFMCGRGKKAFQSELAVTDHIGDAHTTELVGVYKRVNLIDNRDREPSYADREIEARLSIASGEPTDDAWLLGE
jgi:hypothetical protein